MHRLIIFLFFSITFSFADIKPTIAVLATGGKFQLLLIHQLLLFIKQEVFLEAKLLHQYQN